MGRCPSDAEIPGGQVILQELHKPLSPIASTGKTPKDWGRSGLLIILARFELPVFETTAQFHSDT